MLSYIRLYYDALAIGQKDKRKEKKRLEYM